MTARQSGLLACGAVMILTLGARAALLPWMPIPTPIIHDEFSYLLGGDTYAHGRLFNSPHPFWQHFETFQEMQQPVYASKYQPLQGMALALGEKFFGQPWLGVWLSTGLLCAAMCWMLLGWISARWAMAAAVLFAMRIGVLSYWMNSYEGGSVPGIGGALALGALPRIVRRGEWGHAATWALGLGILALSRPYDAAVLGIVSVGILVWWMRKSAVAGPVWTRAAVSAGVVFILVAGAVGYNNARVTGSALTLPYSFHDRQYVVTGMFALLPLKPEPVYRHVVMHDFYAASNVDMWKDVRSEPFTQSVAKLSIIGDFFFGFWPIMVPLLLWPSALDTIEKRLTVVLLGVFVLMVVPLIGVLPHYAGAFAGIFYLRFLYNWSRLNAWRPAGKPVGSVLAMAIGAMFVVAFSHSVFGIVRHGESPAFFSDQDSMTRRFGERQVEFGNVREAMARHFAKMPQKQLVMVRYSPDHNLQNEWVYNAADIDAAPVVWAREMGPQEDRPLVEYFHDRQAWLLEPDQTPPRLTPYCEPK